MDKKEENQGPIINSVQGELKPVDYSRIIALRKKAGVTKKYLEECEKQYKKPSSPSQKQK